MAFNIGLSGIRAASGDLEITGNNVANASTIGFKASRAEFVDVYTTTLLGTGFNQTGSGVLLDTVAQHFNQGNISATENSLDLAIDGDGFFVLSDNGVESYTRQGMFGLDKNGFLVSNNGSRVQGFEATESGLVDGVMGDINIQVGNQPPSLTSLVSSFVNLNSAAQILAEEGTQHTTTGLAIGTADTGLADATTTTALTVGPPTTAGTAPNVTMGAAWTSADPGGTETLTFNLNQGLGSQVVTVTAGAFTADIDAMMASLQNDIDGVLGTNEITVSQTGGIITFTRTGIHATDGSNFSLSFNGAAETFLSDGGVTPEVYTSSVAGLELFSGTTPLTVDFSSTEGTATSTRTTATPPLNITSFVAGSLPSLTGTVVSGSFDLSTTDLNFSISMNGGTPDTIALNNANATAAGVVDPSTMSIADIATTIQYVASTVLVPALDITATESGGQITIAAGATDYSTGDSMQIADAASTSAYTLTDIGFLSANRVNIGTPDTEANNTFSIELTGTNAGGPFTVVIPTANYSSVTDLATAIQAQINTNIGAGGVADKVTVEAVSNQLVFTTSQVGSTESILLTSAAGVPLSALNLDSMITTTGIDTVDRSNSFRITLQVPAPDEDNRSGSVIVSLDEDYRSVAQIATSINRQLNSVATDEYIGVQARATEILPSTIPPRYQLEFVATVEGEASTISITELQAAGADVTINEVAAALQIDADNASLFTSGVAAVGNNYPEQTVILTTPDGEEITVTTEENESANSIASTFNALPGVSASATTQMTIPSASFNNPSDNMVLTLNGQELTDANTLEEIALAINTFRPTTLPAILAEVNTDGDLVITSEIGVDLEISMSSTDTSDSMVVQGLDGTGPVSLGGSSSADLTAVVGGSVQFTLNEDYTLSQPSPVITGLFSALTEDEFTAYTINAFDPDNEETYNFATSVEIYDSLGNAHVMTQYFVKEPYDPAQPTQTNIWTMAVRIDGRDVGDPDPTLPFPDNLEPTRATFPLFFNSDGTLDEEATGEMLISNWDPLDEDGNPNGALTSMNLLEGGGLPIEEPFASSNFEIRLDGSTQFGIDSGANDVNQNGYTTGRLTGLEVNSDGTIFARYTNGQAQTLGQVALATFRNPEGLIPLGDTSWGESFESGNPTIGTPRTASFGSINSSALEDSNVQLSEQLVRLIIAQRNFQASAKTIETSDTVTQTIINL